MAPRPRPKALTKAQVTSEPSIVGWEKIYGDLVPALKERLPQDEGLDDESILRYLAEWGGDIDACLKGYANTKAFRESYFPITKEEIYRSLKTNKFVIHGLDRVGRPVVYYRVCLHDPKAFTPAETLRHVVYLYEELQERIRTDPSFKACPEEVCVVIDRTNAKFTNTDVEFLKVFYQTFKDVYPARCESFIVLGANMMFKGIWALVKPFLDVKSQSGTFMTKDIKELKEFIAEDQMPDFIGGPSPYTAPVWEDEEETKEERDD